MNTIIKKHKYFPDFRIGNNYVELKGKQFFKDKDPLNEMINPYDRTLDSGMQAKYKCMVKNKIIIVIV